MTPWRPRSFALLPIALAILLVGCSGIDAAGPTTTTPDTGAFPVTIPSRFGGVTIDSPPRRIVALDYAAADGAIALGVIPVGMPSVSAVPDGIQSWRKVALRGQPAPTLLNVDTEVPLERIAELRPDLILATNTYQLDAELYERLRRIAPTVHFAEDPLKSTWQESTIRIGQAFGREQRARELVLETERELQAARERTPAFEGAMVSLFLASPAGVGVTNDPADPFARFFSDLGMHLDPDIAAIDAPSGRLVISSEQYPLLDADLIVGSGVTPDVLAELEGNALFARLGAVQEGRYVRLGFEPLTALTLPSLLSVQYAVGEIVPQLAKALKVKTSQ